MSLKRVSKIYPRIYDFRNILDTYRTQIAINTKNKNRVYKFDQNLLLNLTILRQELMHKKRIVHKYNIFLIHEPKARIIMSLNIKDKLINHLVAKYLLIDVFKKSFIDANVATRLGMGTSYGIKLTKKYINELKIISPNIYYLKCDISKYFYQIDHDVLLKQIKRRIKDKDAIRIISDIIDSSNEIYISDDIKKIKQDEIKRIDNLNIPITEKEKKKYEILNIPEFQNNKGIPIGNMTSQIFALIYLNDLDHFIKEELKIKGYIRYMDDFILLHHDKEYLKQCLKIIDHKLEYEYKLKFNPKTCIGHIKNGIDFLGFRFYLNDNSKLLLKVRNNTKRRFKKKLKTNYQKLQKKVISDYDFKQLVASYKGHLLQGNTYKLFINEVNKYKINKGTSYTIGSSSNVSNVNNNGNGTGNNAPNTWLAVRPDLIKTDSLK